MMVKHTYCIKYVAFINYQSLRDRTTQGLESEIMVQNPYAKDSGDHQCFRVESCHKTENRLSRIFGIYSVVYLHSTTRKSHAESLN